MTPRPVFLTRTQRAAIAARRLLAVGIVGALAVAGAVFWSFS